MSAVSFAKALTVAQVHTPTALGNQKPKKGAQPFKAFIGEAPVAKRALHAHDEDTAKTPFLYDVNALSSLRPDQVPRFFGALTDSEKLPKQTVKLADLHAMQDRVDPKKVSFFRENDTGKLPVVVQNAGKKYIADGHHRLAGQWMNGDEEADVRFKDISEVSNAMKARTSHFAFAKADESLGVVFGWAIVCKTDGQDYYDWNVDHAGPHAGELVPEHITEDCMLKSAVGFMGSTIRPGNEQHAGPDVGEFVFAFPLTTDIAKAMGIRCDKSGLMVGYKAPKAVLAKFADGTYTGFSIEGRRMPGGSVEHA